MTSYKIGDRKVERYEIEILKTVERLHMVLTGSGGDAPDEDVAYMVACLEARLADWTPSTPGWSVLYDEAVRQLVMAVLQEYLYYKAEPPPAKPIPGPGRLVMK